MKNEKNTVVVLTRVITVLPTSDIITNARRSACARHYHDVYQPQSLPSPPSTTFRCYDTTLERRSLIRSSHSSNKSAACTRRGYAVGKGACVEKIGYAGSLFLRGSARSDTPLGSGCQALPFCGLSRLAVPSPNRRM
ncbi:hypothetical protein J6590_062002 [Homalodisca vitripennis]|nr:hypothetical protein J6590_062002 [Homalodisca vitripennis]